MHSSTDSGSSQTVRKPTEETGASLLHPRFVVHINVSHAQACMSLSTTCTSFSLSADKKQLHRGQCTTSEDVTELLSINFTPQTSPHPLDHHFSSL